jgi:hypothetical protein
MARTSLLGFHAVPGSYMVVGFHLLNDSHEHYGFHSRYGSHGTLGVHLSAWLAPILRFPPFKWLALSMWASPFVMARTRSMDFT